MELGVTYAFRDGPFFVLECDVGGDALESLGDAVAPSVWDQYISALGGWIRV